MNNLLLEQQMFQEAREPEAPDWNDLASVIDDALEHQHFNMVYQPLLSMQSGELLGFEALVRCQSPRFGFISPEDFIPHAEQSGRIVALGDWILQTTLLDLKRYHRYGFHRLSMSINVSPVQIVEDNFFERVMTLISTLELPPDAVKLELTETALIRNPQVVAKVFHAFQQEGIKIWIDDFGTGFASLNLLRKFKVDGLKIDRSFVAGLAGNNDDFTLCSAIVAMAQRLGLDVVAEGIEDETQLQILNQLGCEVGQGYLLGRPAPFDHNLTLWLQDTSKSVC